MGWKAQSFPSLYRSVVGFVHFHGRTQAQTAFFGPPGLPKQKYPQSPNQLRSRDTR